VAAIGGLALLFGAGYVLDTHLGRIAFFAAPSARVPTPLLLALAVIGGAASFFSPCSIALTPAFLTYFVPGAAGDRRRLVRGSVLVALGMLGFYAVAGLLVGTIGAVVYNVLIYLLPFLGFLFLGLGYLIVTDQGARLFAGLFRWRSASAAAGDTAAPLVSGRREWDLLAFGAAYGAASHTCTLPIFLGIVLVPLAVGNALLAALTTLLYGMALAGLLVTMAGLGQGVLLRLRRAWGSRLQQATGGLFLLTGLYLLYYFAHNFGAVL